MTRHGDDALHPPVDLDARYHGFPPFAQWETAGVELGVFDVANTAWADQRVAADEKLVKAAIDFAIRAAAFDTGAIEGLYTTNRGVTFSVAVQAAAWEATVAQEAGRDAQRHFEAQLRGFELVLDAVTGRERITAAWLRALHETISAGQDTYRALTSIGWQDLPLPRGRYKELPNHVLQPDGTWRSYAPVVMTQSEVQRLVDEINSDVFQSAHPVVQSTYAHYALVGIHPFADGNGRVARALSSVFLYRAAWVPLLIFADERPRYLDALRAADSGDNAYLAAFLRDVAVDAIELVAQRLRAIESGAGDALARLSKIAASAAAASLARVDRAAERVVTALREAVSSHAAAVSPRVADLSVEHLLLPLRNPAGLPLRSPAGLPLRSPVGFVPLSSSEGSQSGIGVKVVARTARLRDVRVDRAAGIFVANDLTTQLSVCVAATDGQQRSLGFRIDAIHPVLTTAARQRIDDWAAEFVGILLAALAERVEAALSSLPEEPTGPINR